MAIGGGPWKKSNKSGKFCARGLHQPESWLNFYSVRLRKMSKDHKDQPNGHSGAAHGEHHRHEHQDEHARAGHEHHPGHDDAHEHEASGGNQEIDALKASLTEKDQEIADLKDKYLRAVAEMDNTRKRLRQQTEETVRRERENLLREILPVVDNLERAISAARSSGDGQSIVDGVEMVLRSMLDLLKAQGVTPIESVGQPFDPARHEAVDHVPSDKHAPNTVIEEFHRGYQAGDRILRTARVTVSKAGEDGRINSESDSTDVENR
jgi:molecular chaperone GrpE